MARVGELNELGEVIVEVVDGVPVSAEGKQRARTLLAEADRRRDPARRVKLRKALGLASPGD